MWGRALGRQVATRWSEWTGFPLAFKQKGAGKKKINKTGAFVPFWEFQSSCSQALYLCLWGSQHLGDAQRPSAPTAGWLGGGIPTTTCGSGSVLAHRRQTDGAAQGEGSKGIRGHNKRGGWRYRDGTVDLKNIREEAGGKDIRENEPKYGGFWACAASLCTFFFALIFLQQKRGNAGLCSATGSMQWGCGEAGKWWAHLHCFSQL